MSVEAASMRSLLRVQEIDLAIDRLLDGRVKLEQRTQLVDAQAHLAELSGADEALGAQILATSLEIKRFDMEVGTIDERIHREEDRLYKGGVTNPREAQELLNEVAALKLRREPLELKDLELSEIVEKLEADRAELRQRIATCESEVGAIQESIAKLESEIDTSVESKQSDRGDAALGVDGEVLEEYDDIRQKRKGIGVGELNGNTCTACRETLSMVEVDKIKKRAAAGEVKFACEHCSRLLVVV